LSEIFSRSIFLYKQISIDPGEKSGWMILSIDWIGGAAVVNDVTSARDGICNTNLSSFGS